MSELTRIEQRKVDSFVKRYIASKKSRRINNSDLPAGSPMYFYCRECGVHTDTLPESYIGRPCQMCSDCEELKKEALLDVAKEQAQKEHSNA